MRLSLIIACGLLCLLVATMGTSALWDIASIRDSAREAVTVDGQLSQLASDVATQTLESRRYEKDYFLNIADVNARTDYLTKWRASITALDQSMAAFEQAATAAEDQRQAARWREQVARYDKDFERIVQEVAVGRITTPQAANEAFTPFKENIRILTESSALIAERKTAIAHATSVQLDAIGARTTWLVGLLMTVALLVIVGYGATDTRSFRRFCVDCDASLPLEHWIGGEHRCPRCALDRLARDIEEAEKRRRSNSG